MNRHVSHDILKLFGGWGTPLNKRTEKATENITFHKKLAIKTTVQFITVAVIFEVAYILLNLLFLVIMGATSLDQTKAFQAFKPFMIPIMVVVSIAGCGYISYRFMLRPLEHLDEVADAAKKLAHPTDALVTKPQNTFTVSHHNHFNIMVRHVLQNIVHIVPVLVRDKHAA